MLSDDVSEMPKNWNRRFKHNRDKIKTGDIYELAEVVRNLAVREQDKGLSTGEKQMYTRDQEDPRLGDDVRAGEDRGRGRDDLPRRPPDALGQAGGRLLGARIPEDGGRAPRGSKAARAPLDKAFVVLAGRPMIEWSLDALRAAGISRSSWPYRCGHGGGLRNRARRRHPLGIGPRGARGAPGDVVVHDAARPLVTADHFRETLAALANADCAVAAAPMTDTVKEAGPDRLVVGTLDRSRLWAIQTPQAFRREALERALEVGDEVLAWYRRRLVGGAHGRHRARRRVHARQLQGDHAARPGHRRTPAC